MEWQDPLVSLWIRISPFWISLFTGLNKKGLIETMFRVIELCYWEVLMPFLLLSLYSYSQVILVLPSLQTVKVSLVIFMWYMCCSSWVLSHGWHNKCHLELVSSTMWPHSFSVSWKFGIFYDFSIDTIIICIMIIYLLLKYW